MNDTSLTDYAWHEILRLGHYLVATRARCLTYRRTGGSLEASVDSSLGNDADGRSLGGFNLSFPSSGGYRRCPSP